MRRVNPPAGGTGVFVGRGRGVLVGGRRVGVLVGGRGVLVAVGGIGVFVRVGVSVGVAVSVAVGRGGAVGEAVSVGVGVQVAAKTCPRLVAVGLGLSAPAKPNCIELAVKMPPKQTQAKTVKPSTTSVAMRQRF